MRSGKPRQAAQGGYTLVVVLVLLFVTSLGLSLVGPSYAHQVQRERERQLLRIGAMYAQALQAYYEASPGNLKQFPQKLEYLMQDPRFVGVRRHLRQVYDDPLRPGQPLELVRNPDGFIVGVYSASQDAPLSRDGPAGASTARRYSDWKFIAKEGNP